MSDLKKRIVVCIGLFCMFLASLLGPVICWAYFNYQYFNDGVVLARTPFLLSLALFILGLVLGRNIESKSSLICGGLLSASCMSALLYNCWVYLEVPFNLALEQHFLSVEVLYGFVLFTNIVYLLVDYYSYTNWICGICTTLLMIVYSYLCTNFCEMNNFDNPLELFLAFWVPCYLFVFNYGYVVGDIECYPNKLNLVLYGLNSIFFGFLYLAGVIIVRLLKIGTKVASYIDEVREELGLSDGFYMDGAPLSSDCDCDGGCDCGDGD